MQLMYQFLLIKISKITKFHRLLVCNKYPGFFLIFSLTGILLIYCFIIKSLFLPNQQLHQSNQKPFCLESCKSFLIKLVLSSNWNIFLFFFFHFEMVHPRKRLDFKIQNVINIIKDCLIRKNISSQKELINIIRNNVFKINKCNYCFGRLSMLFLTCFLKC